MDGAFSCQPSAFSFYQPLADSVKVLIIRYFTKLVEKLSGFPRTLHRDLRPDKSLGKFETRGSAISFHDRKAME
jgi:hypothetical protein